MELLDGQASCFLQRKGGGSQAGMDEFGCWRAVVAGEGHVVWDRDPQLSRSGVDADCEPAGSGGDCGWWVWGDPEALVLRLCRRPV